MFKNIKKYNQQSKNINNVLNKLKSVLNDRQGTAQASPRQGTAQASPRAQRRPRPGHSSAGPARCFPQKFNRTIKLIDSLVDIPVECSACREMRRQYADNCKILLDAPLYAPDV